MLANQEESLYDVNSDIKSITRELERLSGPLSEPATQELLLRIAQCCDQLAAFEAFDPVVYKRNSFFKSEHVELLLLCWKSGQRTPIHDHSGSRCGVYVVRGCATEIGFEKSGLDLLLPANKKELTSGDITVSYDDEVHMVGNFHASRDDLVTLHCYSPPLRQMKVYPQADTFLANYETLRDQTSKSGCSVVKV